MAAAGTACHERQRAAADEKDDKEEEDGMAAVAAAGFLGAWSCQTDAHTGEVVYVTHPDSLPE